jgi:hypothetical protein
MSVIFNHPLQRLRVEVEQDRHGNDVPGSWDGAQPVAIGLWAVDAGDTDEDVDAREGTVVEYTVRKRGRADLVESDRVVWDGDVYAIEGAIRWQPGPTSRTSHTIVRLRRAEG